MPPDQDRKTAFLAFWTTLPGILTGLAALITAVVGAVALWKTQGDSSSSKSSPSTVSSARTVRIGGSHAKLSPLRAHGRLSMFRGDSADFEGKHTGGPSTESDLTFGPESTVTLHAAATGALAPINKPPKKSECIAALRVRSDSFEIVSKIERKWICVGTAEGNVGVFRIGKVVSTVEVVLDYVVWR